MSLFSPSAAIAFFRTPGVGRTVLVLLGVAFAALLAVAISSVVVTERSARFNDLVRHTQDVRQANARIFQLVLEAETGQRGYLLVGEPSYLDVYGPAVRQLPRGLDRLASLVSDNPDQFRRVAELHGAVRERVGIIQDTIELTDAGEREAALQMVRAGRGRAVMRRVRDLIADIDDHEAKLLVERAAAVERAGTMNLVINTAGLVLILLIAAASVLIIQRYIGAISRSREELDRLNRGLEDKVAERTSDLTRANDEIQRFAYIVSHDLRAPLVNVMGYTSELQAASKAFTRQIQKLKADAPEMLDAEAATAVEEDVPEAIDFIRTSTSKMDRLINAILKLSRDGRRVLTAEPLHMTAAVQAIADSLNHQTEAKGASIRVESLPDVVSDRLALDQVFGNLLDNALKYLDPRRPGEIVVRGWEEPPEVVYEVQDNGRGVDPKDHERIFELFRRAGVQNQPGEGLGLAFVRNAVRRLGGEIDVRSTLGEGSTFVLKFPKRLNPQGEGPE